MFDVERRTLLTTIDLRLWVAPHSLKLGPDGLIYIPCENSAKVAVVDRETNAVIETMDTGSTNWNLYPFSFTPASILND